MDQKVQKVLFATISEEGELTNVKEILSPLPIIRDYSNSRYFPKNGELNNEPSMTIPDQDMPIGDLMKRLANGLPLNGKVPLYAEEGDMPDTSKMDLAERELVIEAAKGEIKEINERHRTRQAAAREFNLNKIVEERLAKKELENKKYKDFLDSADVTRQNTNTP